MSKPRGIAARFWAGADPYHLAKERCLGAKCLAVLCPCRKCVAAIYAAIRRDYAKRVKREKR